MALQELSPISGVVVVGLIAGAAAAFSGKFVAGGLESSIIAPPGCDKHGGRGERGR